MSEQLPMFDATATPPDAPLAHRKRPSRWDDFEGREDLWRRHPRLAEGVRQSLVLWGPPGCGKSTAARLLAQSAGRPCCDFNAVLGGLPELRKVIDRARAQHRQSVLFIDEIHRFNKAQQDALLPYVERGDFLLIGATTQNPRACLNRALLSRLEVVELKALEQHQVLHILQKASQQLAPPLLELIAEQAYGDARQALNMLERLEALGPELTLEQGRKMIKSQGRDYDLGGDRHYDVISAFIKSMRGSDPDAALLWLAVMLDGGEDPVFIARRLVIFAAEDVGNADPMALNLATSTLLAVQHVGMPEARIPLAQATTYLASTFKSNAAYRAIGTALEYVQKAASPYELQVPHHLRNFPPPGSTPYRYPHDFPHHYVPQSYAPSKTPSFYHPTEQGREAGLKQRLESLRKLR